MHIVVLAAVVLSSSSPSTTLGPETALLSCAAAFEAASASDELIRLHDEIPLRFEKALNRGDFDCPVRPLPPQLTSLQDHLSARGFDQARIDIILPGLREVSLVLK